MNEKDKELINKRYDLRIKKFGENITGLRSGTEERRDIRFEILSSIGDLNNKSILDLGCGFADFYKWLKSKNIFVNYTGIDINPKLIEVASKIHPEANFINKDIQKDGIEDCYDFIVCSQTFNNKLIKEDNLELIKSVIEICFDSCKEGLAIDMLSNYVDFKENHLYYYKPEKVFSFCKTLTKRINLRHDYPCYEFCIYLYKDFHGWAK